MGHNTSRERTSNDWTPSSPQQQPSPAAATRTSFYISGRWAQNPTPPPPSKSSPATGVRVVGSTPRADATDVDAAVKAARASFDSGITEQRLTRRTPTSPRPRRRADRGAQRQITALKGRQPRWVRHQRRRHAAAASGPGVLRLPTPVRPRLRAWVEYRQGLFGTTRITYRTGRRGQRDHHAWNVPLFLVYSNKFRPRWPAASIVLKPAPETPLVANYSPNWMAEAGVPARRGSRWCRAAPTPSKALVDHPGVDKITFTGSTAAGKAIGAA